MTRPLVWLTLVVCASACSDEARPSTVAEGIFAPLGEAMPRASAEQKEAFRRGKEVVSHRFSVAEGLGPSFNVVSCGGCHERPVFGGAAARYRNFLLSATELSDGSFVLTAKNGVQTQFMNAPLARTPSDPRTTLHAARNAIAFFGTGLLAQIEDAEILRRADPDDSNGDGISGRPNYDRGFVGRFGVKCQTVSVEGFIRGPLFNHLGLTSVPLSPERKRELPVPSAQSAGTQAALLRRLWITRAHAQVAAPEMPNYDDDGVPDPELSEQQLFDLVSFSMLLAPPTPDPEPSAEAQRGLATFREYACTSCHVEDLAGPLGLVPAYSDLLLHDMGPELADGIRMGQALGSEFRTQPLWGVAATGPYLHDGRAKTLHEAILAHDGEARTAKQAYAAADVSEQNALIAFLDSLGGREHQSPGMIPPNTPITSVGQSGGPRRPLSAGEQERFLRGRALFDRDIAPAEGLGPGFNGDACRSCHFDPVPGGAGSADVDVIRQAPALDVPDAPDGTFGAGHGSLLHRHRVDGKRPSPEALATHYERRQTPTLLGIGLIDEIPDESLLALADPDDLDGDGVSGRTRVMPNGRVGRFGWKLGVPSVPDFVRDGLSNELGLTLPASESAFGLSHDDDAVVDPELGAAELDDLTFWLEELAPPERDLSAAQPDVLARGETAFREVHCASCHLPTMLTREGESVPLYSDLLLHDVGGPTYVGVRDGSAAPREMRTPPLWGLHSSGPYLHDGSAASPEQAIAAHDGEAARSRVAFEALTSESRAALLAFLRSL
jgi:CxxC motif-containing protein (DUF1111 family)